MASEFSQQKALFVLRENIDALLRGRREDQASLARWLGHDKSWLNKFLNKSRGIRVEDLDRVADFFGIATYQLFQPGISALTERRQGQDRRSGQDRRVGHSGRLLVSLRTELNKSPRHAAAFHDDAALRAQAHTEPIPAAVQRIVRDAERRIAAHYRQSTNETTPARRPKADMAPRRGRKSARSDAESA